jgi:hypothetical protein
MRRRHSICVQHDPPSRVLLLRHAEKPADESDPNLSTRGKSRAGALPAWIIKDFGTPVAVYAMLGGAEATRHTLRPIQTVEPLALASGVDLLTSYDYGQTRELAHEVLTTPAYSGGLVVICWVHQELKELARAFGYTKAKAWDGGYDHLWALRDFDASGDEAEPELTSIAQRLLFGDSSH